MLEVSTIILAIIGLLLLIAGPTALMTGLIVASVFQVMAFINLDNSPILIYYFFGILFICRGFVDCMVQPHHGVRFSNNLPLIYLCGFVVIAGIGAIVLPQLFSGTLIYSPKLSIDEQYSSMTRLSLDSQQFNQLAQLLINAGVVLIIWFGNLAPTAFIRAVFISLGIVIFFAFWQWFSNQTGSYFPSEWLYTARGWALGNEQSIGSFTRVNSTFIEPSVLATYLTGICAFLLVLWVRRPSWTMATILLLTILCMAATTSTTAYLGFVWIVLTIVLGIGLVQFIHGGWISTSLLFILLLCGIGGWLGLIAWLGLPEVRDLFDLVVFEKSQGDSFRARWEADWQSFGLVWNTYGLGVGLGSNRPSSFFTFLLSNLGVIGFALFLLFLVSLTRRALRLRWGGDQANACNWSEAAAWGLWGTVFAKVIAQPDLSFAPMWIWIFFLAALANAKIHGQSQTAVSTNQHLPLTR